MIIAAGVYRSINLQLFISTGIVFLFIFLHLSGYSIVFAQRYSTTFGLVSELNVPQNTIGLLTGDFNGDRMMDLATFGDLQFRLFIQSKDSLAFESITFSILRPIIAGAAAKVNKDNITDLIFVLENPLSVQVYLGKSNGKFYLKWEKELVEPFENISVADINSDRKNDIIVYGKKELGATVYLGNGNGTFQSNITILSEYSFSTILITGVHNNGFKDIIASNWISNEILVFSGFGKLKFSEPSVLQCQGEPEIFAAAFLDSDNNLDLIAGFLDQQKCQTYLGDGFGGFQEYQTLQCKNPLMRMAVSDVNGDGKDDLFGLNRTSNCLNVKLNNGKGIFEEDIPFYAGRSPKDFVLFRHANTNIYNAAILDTNLARIRILYNANIIGNNSMERKYCVSEKPGGIVTTDMNRDGWDDILVANTRSNNLSVFMNEGKGKFTGQLSFNITESPSIMKYFQNDDTTAIILSTSPKSDRISVVELNSITYSHTAYTLPTEGTPDVLNVNFDNLTHHPQIYATERDRKNRQITIIKFEKISGSRFLERYYNLDPSYTPILASAMVRHTDGQQRLVFVTYNKNQKKEQVFQTKFLPTEHLASVKLVNSFDESETVSSLLWFTDVDNDDVNDIILSLDEPENKLYISIGQSDSTFAPFKCINENRPIQISSIDRLKIYDVNNDNKSDIIFEDDIGKTIQICYGKGRHIFSQPLRLINSGYIGGFDLSDLDNDSYPELVMTDPLNGIVKIISLRE